MGGALAGCAQDPRKTVFRTPSYSTSRADCQRRALHDPDPKPSTGCGHCRHAVARCAFPSRSLTSSVVAGARRGHTEQAGPAAPFAACVIGMLISSPVMDRGHATPLRERTATMRAEGLSSARSR